MPRFVTAKELPGNDVMKVPPSRVVRLASKQMVVHRPELGNSLPLSPLVLSVRVAQPPLRASSGAKRNALRWTRLTTLRTG